MAGLGFPKLVRDAMDGWGGTLARHCRAFRRTPGQGWPGWAFRSPVR